MKMLGIHFSASLYCSSCLVCFSSKSHDLKKLSRFVVSSNTQKLTLKFPVFLVILQVVLPALLEQTHARTVLKTVVRTWCCFFGRLLQLEHYLLPLEENRNEGQQRAAAPAEPAAGMGLAAQHQALLLVREPQGFQAYRRPSHFSVRVIALLIALSITSVFTSIVLCVVPG